MSSIGTFPITWWSIPASSTLALRVKSFTIWISCYAVSLIITVPWITWTAGVSVCLKRITIFWCIYTLSIWSSCFCVSIFALITRTIREIYASTIWICWNTSSILNNVITLIALITCGVWWLNLTIRHWAIDKC